MSRPNRRLLWWIAGGLVVLVVFGNQGFRQLTARFEEKRRLDKSLVSLRSEHDRLNRELNWLKQDPGYSEYLVRKNLGYVKKGEVEYRFIKNGKSGSSKK